MKNDMPEAKPASAFYRDHVKRVIDLVIAVPVLVVAAIPMAIVALAVKLDSPGPVLFKQDRLGKDGKVFKMLKFRSMCVGAEKTGSGVYSGKNDARVTRVGRFIRATSLDELPQLFNILRGDMSIVGNRPLPLYEAERLTADDCIDRFIAPAGLTGLWQVEERGKGGDMSAEERKQLDIRYGQTYNFSLDMKIIFRTLTAFVQKDNV